MIDVDFQQTELFLKHQEVSDDWKEKTHNIAQKTLMGQLVQ